MSVLRARSVLRVALSTLSWGAIGVAGALLIGRQIGLTSELGVTALALTPQATAVAIGGEACLLLLRARKSAMIGAAVVVAAASVQLPAFIAAPHPGTPPAVLTVMTSNLRLGLADPAAVMALAHDRQVDVLAVQELTRHALNGLTAAGIDRELPYRIVTPRAAGAGIGLWSRHPLTHATALDGFGFDPVSADVGIGGRTVTLVSFHSKAPLYNGGTDQWASDLQRLSTTILKAPSLLVVAGDFNATYDHRQFRDLLADGYTDAARDAGAGIIPTYPADGRFGPLAGIDHVIMSPGLVATTAGSAPVAGSDHRAIITTIALVEPLPAN